MNDENCSTEGCRNIPKLMCSCDFPNVLLCMAHAELHMEQDISKNHNMKPFVPQLSRKELKLLSVLKGKINDYKMKKTIEINEKYKKAVSDLHREYIYELELLVESTESLLRKIEETIVANTTIRASKDPLLSELWSQITKNTKTIYLDNVFSKCLNLATENEQRFNYIFLKNSKIMERVDNHDLTVESIKVDSLPEELGCGAGICVFKDGEVFNCSGFPSGFYKNVIKSVYRINPKTKRWIKLADFPVPASEIIPFRSKNNIYIFGGKNKDVERSKLSWRYSIPNNIWEPIKKLPNKSSNVSCVSLGNSFLITGDSPLGGVYEYNFTNYRKIFSYDSHGVILKNNEDELFLLMSGRIFTSSASDYTNWREAGSYRMLSVSNWLENAPQLYGDYFCFKICGNKYMRFNHKTLTMQYIKFPDN